MNKVMRREPTQRRSRETVRRILRACEELLAEVGYEEAVRTPALILERAEVSKGAFYAYFLAPESAMAAVAVKHLEVILQQTDELALAPRASWREVIDATVERWSASWEDPITRELLLREDLPREVKEANERATEHVAEQLLVALERAAGATGFTKTQALVAIELMERLLHYAHRDSVVGDEVLVAEARVAMTAYVQARMFPHHAQ